MNCIYSNKCNFLRGELLGMFENQEVKVTIVCITYNQEQFIANALDSFLMQKTSFKYQIFVGDDNSKDNTANIILEYARKYPGIIYPFIREKNIGPQRNCIDMCNCAKSTYIALCDGDDYWVDEFKLQKQYEHMELNKNCNVCGARTKIINTDNWAHKNYYIKNKNGEYIMPECYPSYRGVKKYLSAYELIENIFSHTSTLFFRWNYNIKYPAWFFEGVLGDIPLKLLQLGEGKATYIPDVVSVYRINESGVFTKFENKDLMFINSRLEYIRVCSGLLEWYEESKIKNYPKVFLQNKIILETNNYINSCINLNYIDKIKELIEVYPMAFSLCAKYYISANNDRRILEKTFGWEGYKVIVRNRYFRNLLKPYSFFALFILKYKNIFKIRFKNVLKFICYWVYTLIPKNKKIWVVSGFRKKNYMDNTKYFFEYIVNNNPEINIYWMTDSNRIYDDLNAKNFPVLKMRSLKGIWMTARARVGIVDHYAVNDFNPFFGFNDNVGVVQLFHGVGFKSAVDKNGKFTANEPGFRRSDDIIIKKEDSLLNKIKKSIKYFIYAPNRELLEKYLLFLTPGKQMVENFAIPWGVNSKAFFTAGYPRIIHFFDKKNQYSNKFIKILYAPTYRWNAKSESEFIDLFLDNLKIIHDNLNNIDGYLTIRLHPHTWRNYQNKIKSAISIYEGIDFDTEKDVYSKLDSYDMLITDYSSIATDFATLNRPTIYFCPDYEDYCKDDAGLIENFKDVITGPFVCSWDDVFKEVEKFKNVPNYYQDIVKNRLDYFYDHRFNNVHNSKRIVDEIKRRIKF